MRDALRLVRAPNLLIAAAGVLAGGWIAARQVTFDKLLIFAAISGIGLGAVGNAWNDVRDVAADRVNRPERPLPAGGVSRNTANLVLLLTLLLGVACAALVSGAQVLAAMVALVVMLIYSPALKPLPVVGNAAVAVVAGSPPFYGALALGMPAAGIVPWVLAAWLHGTREVVKDLEDEPGDRAIGRRTLPIALGRAGAARGAAVLATVFVPVSMVLPWRAAYGGWYFALAALAQLVALVVAWRVWRNRSAGASGLLKGGMVIGLIALVAGRIA